MKRVDGRDVHDLRSIKLIPNILPHAEGSVQVEFGKTRVICTASVEETVPSFLKGKGSGWVTGEYGMLPRSTDTRMRRERDKVGGRTMEIQRLIGRSLRAAVDLTKLGERSITVDCDVICADGGTRTASITGGYVALALAVQTLMKKGLLAANPGLVPVAAVSVGIVNGTPVLDLNYIEDSSAGVDMNFVINARGEFIEVQGTAEHGVFTWDQMESLKNLAFQGCQKLHFLQSELLG